MTGKTHLAGGLAIGLTLERATVMAGLPLLPPNLNVNVAGLVIPAAAIAFIALGLGSLLPDIDEPNSMASNLPRVSRGVVRQTLRKRGLEGLVRLAAEIVLTVLNLLTRALSRVVRGLAMGHRGATHWFVTCLVIGLAAGLSGWLLLDFPDLGFWLMLGCLVHLGLDMMTISGLEVLQPLTDQTFHLLPPGFRIRTGNMVDAGLALVFSLIAVTMVYLSLWRTMNFTVIFERVIAILN